MDLLPFLITKISHDISGCAGTVLNTSELLMLEQNVDTEILSLLNQGAKNLIARLKFFRCILGLKTEINNGIADNYLKTLSVPFTLEGTVQTPVDLAVVLLLSELLIRGGTIRLTPAGATATGPRIKDISAVQHIFDGTDKTPVEETGFIFWLRDQWAHQNRQGNLAVSENVVSLTVLEK